MTQRLIVRIGIVAIVVVLTHAAQAQIPAEPGAYTVTVRYTITAPLVRTTYRLGPMILEDQHSDDPAEAATRTLYDLNKHRRLSWDPANPSGACERSTFDLASWQDPFSGGHDLTMKTVLHKGTETLHGIAAQILESTDQSRPFFRLWVDPQTGLMLRSQFVSPKPGTAMTYFEVTAVSLKAPPASVFVTPASCERTTANPQ